MAYHNTIYFVEQQTNNGLNGLMAILHYVFISNTHTHAHCAYKMRDSLILPQLNCNFRKKSYHNCTIIADKEAFCVIWWNQHFLLEIRVNSDICHICCLYARIKTIASISSQYLVEVHCIRPLSRTAVLNV